MNCVCVCVCVLINEWFDDIARTSSKGNQINSDQGRSTDLADFEKSTLKG